MKQIIAVIQPSRLPRVREAARRFAGFPGMTVDKVDGFSPSSGSNESAPAGGIRSELTEYSPKVRLMILAPDHLIYAIAELIHDCCHSGERGDGLIWTVPVDETIRIRDSYRPGDRT